MAPTLSPTTANRRGKSLRFARRAANNTAMESYPCKYSDKLRSALEASIRAKQEFLGLEDRLEIFGRAVECVVAAYRGGGRLYLAGNGGSAADAQHIAAEFVVKLSRPRA